MRILKSVFLSALIASCSFANNDIQSNIQSILKDRTNLDFKIISSNSEPLRDAVFVVVESPSGERLSLLASKDGSYIVPIADGISSSTNSNSLKTAIQSVSKYNKDMNDKNVLSIFSKNPDSILKISSSSNTKRVIHMVLDTTCPYCLQEVKHIDDYLKNANVEILIVGILGQRAQERAAGYYAELPNAKSREQKIALLKKVFEADYKPTKSNAKLSNEMTSLVIGAGVNGVPYIIGR